MGNLLYEDLSYKLRGCFEEKINFIEKKRLKIKFKGLEIGVYEPDFIIEDKIIVEIKSVLLMSTVFERQLYFYFGVGKYKTLS